MLSTIVSIREEHHLSGQLSVGRRSIASFLTSADRTRDRQELGIKLLNLVFRLASMAGKFGLSLFIARYLDLSGLGVYGIVFSISMFMVMFFGGRIDHEMCRRIVLLPKARAAQLLRDQSLFYLLNFLAFLPCFLVAGAIGLPGFGMGIAICTFAICCLEAYGNLLFVNANALGKSLMANAAFFVRSGLWALLAMAALVLFPPLRTIWTILLLWIGGSAASIWLNLELLEFRRWPSVRQIAVDWRDLRSGLSITFMIWLGSIGLAGGTYLDRVVLGAYLDLKAVGVATFYSSFGNAVVTLISSSSFAVALPKLVRFVDMRDRSAFAEELKSLAWYTCILGLGLCLLIGLLVPKLSSVVHKPEIYEYRYTLWLLMVAAMFRVAAEGAYAGLYALRRDVSIWSGNMAFLVLSLLASVCLIARFGLIGLGVANTFAALFLLLFRLRGLTARRLQESSGR